MIIHFRIIGVLLILLALSHDVFPRYFKWELELKGLSLVNRQMMVIHTFFIALGVLLLGVLCLTSGDELVGTVLGRKIAVGMGVFWLIRLLIQFFGYSAVLWRGRRFETIVHYLFVLFFGYMSVVFFSVLY